MENSSKALLIAAAVLIAILLITFSIRIFQSTSSTNKDAEEVGSSISQQIQVASKDATKNINPNLIDLSDISFCKVKQRGWGASISKLDNNWVMKNLKPNTVYEISYHIKCTYAPQNLERYARRCQPRYLAI